MYVVLEFMCVKGICVVGLFDCRSRMGGWRMKREYFCSCQKVYEL